ncbi:MAG: ATP-grasp domain-containing protein [Candidatus Omnitrophota bacterium]
MKEKTFKKILVVFGMGDYTSEDVTAVFKCRDAVLNSLSALGYFAECFGIRKNIFISSPQSFITKIRDISPDCVFNLFEGFPGRPESESTFVRMLEKEKIPFTGNNSAALETCLDKHKTKKILAENGIKTPAGALIKNIAALSPETYFFPVFVKPAFEDASVGIDEISLALTPEELRDALKTKLKCFPGGLIVEEFIPGKEFNAAFLGDYPYENLGISLMDHEEHADCPSYLNFSSKWKENTTEYKKLMPRVLDKKDPEYRNDIIDISRRAAKAVGCTKYFRVDLREKNGELYVLDINPNPDISPDSGLIRQAASLGMDYTNVISEILCNANRS